MTNPPPPETVTRFYGRVDYALDVLQNRQIAFVHVSMLNDPFDPYCFFETDFGDSYPSLIAYVRENHPQDLGWFRAHVTPRSWVTTVRPIKAHLQNLRETAFVLSTCAVYEALEPQRNLYMWGHYAHGHRGLAIEFDTQALADAVLAHHEAENKHPIDDTADVWAKIEYAKSFSPISAENVFQFVKQERDFHARKIKVRKPTAIGAYYNRMSIIKSNVWEREAEWRLMWTSAESREVYKCPIEANAVRAVYLGLNLPKAELDEIVSATKAMFPNATLFRARKRHGDLAIEFDPA